MTVIGKGNKERTIYLNNACMRSVKEYLNILALVAGLLLSSVARYDINACFKLWNAFVRTS